MVLIMLSRGHHGHGGRIDENEWVGGINKANPYVNCANCA